MNKQEAISAMKAGKKLTHPWFAPGEWIGMRGDEIMLENETVINQEAFWGHRSQPEWEKHWEVAPMTNEHTQEKHTPLPWEKSPKYSPNQDEYIEIIKGGVIIARIYNSNFQQGIKRGEGEANAEYIVKACNAYPSLVEALERMMKKYDFNDQLPADHPIVAARAALKQTEG